MIEFNSVKFKNFFNFGATFTELQFDQYNNTIITGQNGVGKSTIILESIHVALFGSSFRNINKNEIVNNINKKNCEIQLLFQKNGNEYIVERGIKPNFLKVYKNGEQVESKSSDTELQKYLEEKILQFNEKVFKQICIFGSSLYQPFMKLSLGDRRFIIENILNLEVFSNMLDSIKSKIKDNDIQVAEMVSKINLTENSISIIKKNIEDNEINNSKLIIENQNKIVSTNKQKEITILNLSKIEKERESNKVKYDNLVKNIKSGIEIIRIKDKKISEYKTKLKYIKQNIDLVTNNESCPVCKNSLKDNSILAILQKEEMDCNDVLNTLDAEYSDIQNLYNKVNSDKELLEKKITSDDSLYYSLKNDVNKFDHIISSCNELIIELNKKKDVDTCQLVKFEEDLKVYKKSLVELKDKDKYFQSLKKICGDKGIKSFIVEKYLSYINERINYYADKFDLGFGFTFDNQFNETIVSNFKKDIPFNGLSEGQKARLNFSILFSFIDVTKKLNSIDTNMLVFDEILDGSLDQDGTKKLIEVLKEMSDMGKKIFVISHNQDMKSLFDEHIEIKWDGLFGCIKD